MTKQEIFDKVAAHFAVQLAPAIDEEGNCQYRAEDGHKCAVGALIPDDAYDPKCESSVVEFLFERWPDMMQAAGLCREDCGFLERIQFSHDHARQDANFLADLPVYMAKVAVRYALDPSCLTALTAQREPQ